MAITPSRRRLAGKAPAAILASLLLLIGGAVAYMAYLGYFGGDIYTDVPVAAGARRNPAGLSAVVLSGDMGFHAGMGPLIAERLAADGIPVTGINSLSFFRRDRTPDEAAGLVAQAMHRAIAGSPGDKVVLIGQSFGADMLQAGLSRLNPAMRAHVAMVALVVPGETVSFRASPANLFAFGEEESDALPTARQLGWAPTVCIFGVEETNSLCPRLSPARVTRIGLPGGHPLHGDADALYAALYGQIRRATMPR